jgi:Putative zinc-finger
VAQENGHPTTEQLSAFLDGEVSADERTQWDAHLKTCQSCSQELASLRQTVALLRALPQPALPRSFVLPAEVAGPVALPMAAAVRQAAGPTPMRTAERLQPRKPYLRVAFRTLSALAAVIGIVFFLSGIVPALTHGGGTSQSTSASAPENKSNTAQGTSPHVSTGGTPGTMAPAVRTPAATNSGNNSANQQPGATNWPTILIFNLSTPEGRLGFGIILFILGMMGYVLFKRQRAP